MCGQKGWGVLCALSAVDRLWFGGRGGLRRYARSARLAGWDIAWRAGYWVCRSALTKRSPDRLGGITGDTLGAACELTETVVLLTAVLSAGLEF